MLATNPFFGRKSFCICRHLKTSINYSFEGSCHSLVVSSRTKICAIFANMSSILTLFTKNFGEALINVRLRAVPPKGLFAHEVCFQLRPRLLIEVHQLPHL